MLSRDFGLSADTMSAEVTAALQMDGISQLLSSTSQLKAKMQWKDAPKNYESSRKKPPSLEVQRISDLLENCISQVEIIAILPAVLCHLDSLSSGLNEEFKRALQKHQQLEERLLDDLRQESDGKQEGEVEEAGKKSRSQLESVIKNSIRDLLRLFRANPDDFSALRAGLGIEKRVSEPMQSLIEALKKFHMDMTELLETNLDEESQQELYLKELSSCHTHNAKLIVELEKKVSEAIMDRDTYFSPQISKKEALIKKLEVHLQQQKKTTEDIMSQMQQDADKQCQSYVETSEMQQTCLQQEVDQLNIQLNNVILENWKKERALQEKNKRVERETEFMLKEFDDDMEKEQTELEEMEKAYEQEKEEFEQLEKAYDIMMEEYNQIQEECRLEEEKQKELELKIKATILIQALWRGYCTRKAIKAMAKTKKPKKGKGKKKKK
ncbi:hypothetical protein LDENG_00099230 [Lucifuga dentata]|nr:hypothetical protein LDENG_00099230 [Lucifuga dentata]